MKEHPIIFSTDMVKAILEGRKTQTRRVIKPQPEYQDNTNIYWGNKWCFVNDIKDSMPQFCPYGQVGNRLVIKETWATENRYNHLKPSEVPRTAKIWYLADEQYNPFLMGKVRSAMFMCYWMSRARPEITEVRVEKLRDIIEEDIKKEGCPSIVCGVGHRLQWFKELWDSLNAKRGYSWESNPWVWVISFKMQEV